MTRIIVALGLLSVTAIGTACAPSTAASQPAAPAQGAYSASQPAPPAQGAYPAAAGPAPTPARAERVNGTVQDNTAGKVTLADGKTFAVTPQTRIVRLEAASAGDLQPGQYVAVTAKRQADGTLLASIVNIFAESMRGLGPGQRPMDEGNLMTNATVDTVAGDTFAVSFPGGGARVKLAPDAKIGRLVDGSPADIKPGGQISASVADGAALSVSLR